MQKKQFSRRQFLTLVSTAGGAVLLAACTPSAQPATTEGEASADQPAGERTVVHCWLGWYTPSEWTTRSAENPIVVNATRILAQRFEEPNPKIEIMFEEGPGSDDYFAWLTAAATAGTPPDLIWNTHNFAVQNGWAMLMEDYLDLPNPHAPQYETWRDIFYPAYMTPSGLTLRLAGL